MENKNITIFHEQLKKILLPYLGDNNFHIESKQIDETIGSYKLTLKNNTKIISLSFSMHHYDLSDGIVVKLYHENDLDTIQTLNSIVEKEYKIYSQLKPESSLFEILSDLKEYCGDFFHKN